MARLAVSQQSEADLLLQPSRPAARRTVGRTLARRAVAAGLAPLARALECLRSTARSAVGSALASARRSSRWGGPSGPACRSAGGRRWSSRSARFLDWPTSCARGACAVNWPASDQRRWWRPTRSHARSSLPIAIVLAIVSGQYLPVRFDYTIAGAVLASLLLFSESLAWQTAITATCAAFAWDFLDYQTFAPLPTGVDLRRRHDRRRHDHRCPLSANAPHASPVDLDRRGQRLSLSSAAVHSRT